MKRRSGVALVLFIVTVLVVGTVMRLTEQRGAEPTPSAVVDHSTGENDDSVAQPGGTAARTAVKGIVEYTVRDANGNIKEHAVIHNTVNDPEALNEVFNRIAAAASGVAYDGIAALGVPANGSGSDDPSDGVDAASIALNLDGDSGTVGEQNPADGTVATDFGTESGNGTVVVLFTATANLVDVKQVVLTKAAENNTLQGADAIADADIFSYLDVPDVQLNSGDTVQYTWTIDVD